MRLTVGLECAAYATCSAAENMAKEPEVEVLASTWSIAAKTPAHRNCTASSTHYC